MQRLKAFSYLFSVICLIASFVFVATGFGKLDSGYNNTYVGGDAYNYIINGTYFSGYMVLAASCFIGAILLLMLGCFISYKENQK